MQHIIINLINLNIRIDIDLIIACMAYELSLQHVEDRLVLDVVPAPYMTEEYSSRFFSQSARGNLLYSEIGSRSYIRLGKDKSRSYGVWNVVQSGLYEYMIGQSGGDWGKFVIDDSLDCKVVWE